LADEATTAVDETASFDEDEDADAAEFNLT